MINCLSYDVYNINIDMDFLNKVEVIEQDRQSVMNGGIVAFFSSVIRNCVPDYYYQITIIRLVLSEYNY